MTGILIVLAAILMLLCVALSKRVVSMEREIEYLNQDAKEMMKDCEEWHKRCNEAEDAVEKGYGIKVRTETTNKVETDFSKLEMVIIVSGVEKLLKDSKSPQDAEIYINLFKKINALLEVMEEES